MLYHIFKYLEEHYNLTGAGLFQFITFRASMAIILSLVISLVIGKGIIRRLQLAQIGEIVRDLGLEGQLSKKGTPTMGGIIIILAILIPALLFARLDNVYVILAIVSTVWMGAIGFLDDYIKVFKKDKEGLSGRFKILAQIGLGLIVGITLFFNQDVVVRDYSNIYVYKLEKGKPVGDPVDVQPAMGVFYEKGGIEEDGYYYTHDTRSVETNVPFLKNNALDYALPLKFLGEDYQKWAWLIFIPFVIFIITAVSNAANLTDGIDGLATGVSAIIILTLGVFAYVSGNVNLADYLNILYIPNSGELVIFSAAMVGACIGFLWYNAFPAQVFMGDTGSLMLGGLIATLAIMVRKELLIPILCGIFVVENLSVVLQVGYFKFTKKKYGEGRRIFKMAPLHHHYQKSGFHESKIVTRFWIIGILLAVLTIITLKIR
ncbi:MAG: phospho-N-acetylmuramoyl-pentapeptide-transferase [Chitinophagales bacterium]|nr:phospho-N-acetylmuramoyl-pentapeptide-transferase [Chitinophagales bacterium]